MVFLLQSVSNDVTQLISVSSPESLRFQGRGHRAGGTHEGSRSANLAHERDSKWNTHAQVGRCRSS